MFYINLAANIIVAAVCLWAVMSRRVNDGWFGKCALMVLCLAACANAAWAWLYSISSYRHEVLFNVAAACMALRCYWIKSHRASVRRWCRRWVCRE